MKLPQQSPEQDGNEPIPRPDRIKRNQEKTRLISIASLFVFLACAILSFQGHADHALSKPCRRGNTKCLIASLFSWLTITFSLESFSYR